MAYTTINFKTKKDLKAALASGIRVSVFNPGLGQAPVNGPVSLEGPHYPQPHTWYASGKMENGFLKEVK